MRATTKLICLLSLAVAILLFIDFRQMQVIVAQREWIAKAMDVLVRVKGLIQHCTISSGTSLVSNQLRP